ncbi:MAG: hypothetical protein JWR77_474 [Rhizorhabdus sp.]|nr:hypothetical protein [Rhizorhabdus sp.]
MMRVLSFLLSSEPSPACGRGLGEGLLLVCPPNWNPFAGLKKKEDPHPTFSRKREKAKRSKGSAFAGMTVWGGLAILLALATPAQARKPEAVAPTCTGTIKPSLFISPMGEPFRPKGDGIDPMQAWFAGADTDHDGRLTIAEMMLDADRFFATLDHDHDGQLLPDEVDAYEENIAPEVRLYQPRGKRPDEGGRKDPPRPGPKGAAPYGGAIGAGRFSFFNIPNPVASADDDINRAVDRAEFRAAAAERFRLLDPQQKKALAFADLPRTPAQASANAVCLIAMKAQK